MTAHVSVFDLKRFAEERLAADELPSFEDHLSACASCADRLQLAAARELHSRGLDAYLGETKPRPVGAVLIAVAASVLFALSLGQGPMLRFAPHARGPGASELHPGSPFTSVPADGVLQQVNSDAMHDKRVTVHGKHYPSTGTILVDSIVEAK